MPTLNLLMLSCDHGKMGLMDYTKNSKQNPKSKTAGMTVRIQLFQML